MTAQPWWWCPFERRKGPKKLSSLPKVTEPVSSRSVGPGLRSSVSQPQGLCILSPKPLDSGHPWWCSLTSPNAVPNKLLMISPSREWSNYPLFSTPLPPSYFTRCSLWPEAFLTGTSHLHFHPFQQWPEWSVALFFRPASPSLERLLQMWNPKLHPRPTAYES